jgi:Glycosyl hydrolase family 79 C-terminal beta domain
VLVGTLLASLACALSGCAQAHRRPADPPAGRRLAVERRDATRPLPARVTITPQAAMTPIPRSYLGLSTEYSALPQWSSSMSLLERVLSLVHVTRGGPLVLRVGGDSADRSFWDPDAAPMPRWAFTLGPPWLDQARDLVRRLGIKLILDLNLITDSPTTAAQWARAAETGLPHSSIIAFEVGNEPDIYNRADWLAIIAGRRFAGRSPLSRPLPATLTARSYAADFRDYAEALQQVAPHTVLAGPALANPVAHERWLTALFAGGGHSLGLVTIHRYPYSACVRARAGATIAHLLSAAATTAMAAALRPDVEAAHDAGRPLRLTELNSVNCGGRPGVSDAFATALWAPDALFALLRAGVDGVNLHVRADAVNAPFALTADGLDARPLLYGLILFARALGPQARLVKVTTHYARFVDLSVWGVRVGPGTLHVVLIDTSRRSVRVTLRLPATADAKVQRLLAPSASAETGVTLGGRSLGRDGLWQGQTIHQTVARRRTGYVVDVRQQSASLLSVRVTPGALQAPGASTALTIARPAITGAQRPHVAGRGPRAARSPRR